MYIFDSAPLVRVLIPFITGIVTYNYLPKFKYDWVVLGILFFVLIGVYSIPKLSTYRYKTIFGIISTILLFYAGYCITNLNTSNHSNHFSHCLKNSPTRTVAQVTDYHSTSKGNSKLDIKVLQIDSNSCFGKGELFINMPFSEGQFQFGDILQVRCTWNTIDEPKNPNEFNYKAFSRNNQIYHQAFIQKNDFIKVASNKGNFLHRKARQLQSSLIKVLKKHKISNDELAICSALILGNKQYLEADLLEKYANVGATHVLAVSGLHVGILYIILSKVLELFKPRKKEKIWLTKPIIIILFLWFYAMITGLSPSVLRACTMFSFVVIGTTIKRNVNIYNTIGASALFLLCINPFLIYSVGFQLSYIAVIGIIYIQPRLYNYLNPTNKIIDYIWQLSSVSIAAQIATFPLCIYYFNQFPNYFLLSNLVVIPFATFIIYCGIFVFLSNPITALSNLFAKLLVLIVKFLNNAIKWIEELPYTIIDNLYLNISEVLLIYIAIIILLGWISLKKYQLMVTVLICLITFNISKGLQKHRIFTSNKFIVYHTYKSPLISYIIGRNHYISTCDTLNLNNPNFKNYWQRLGLESPVILNDNYKNEHILHNQSTTLLHDKIFYELTSSHTNPPSHINEIEYLIYSSNTYISLSQLTTTTVIKNVIIHSGVRKNIEKKVIKDCEILHIPFHSIRQSNAYELSI